MIDPLAWVLVGLLLLFNSVPSRGTLSVGKTNANHRSELFYIYNSSEWLNIISAPLSQRAPNEIMDVILNGGAGPLIDASLSLYHTDQYSLFQLMFNRAVKDPRRTLDPSKATSFIIPYDFASDVAFMSRRPFLTTLVAH